MNLRSSESQFATEAPGKERLQLSPAAPSSDLRPDGNPIWLFSFLTLGPLWDVRACEHERLARDLHDPLIRAAARPEVHMRQGDLRYLRSDDSEVPVSERGCQGSRQARRSCSIGVRIGADAFCAGVAAALKAERLRLGLSMSALAERAGISQQMVSYVDRGTRKPTLDTIVRMAIALEVSLSEIVEGTEYRNR